MNILQFICPVGFYGAERWILALVNNADPNVVRYDLAVTDETAGQDLRIVDQFPKNHGRAYKLPMASRFDFSVVSKLVKIIKDRQIDIIHTHGYKSDILGLLAAKRAGIKAVATPHGFGMPNDFKLKMFVRLGAFSLRFFDLVVPLSHQLKAEVSEFGVSETKIHYIQNGVDLTEIDRYLSDGEHHHKKAEAKIGFVGQMIPRKNLRDLLDVFDLVHKELPHTKLQLLGDGEERPELELYAKSLPSHHAIEFLGFRDDRMNYLRDFQLFVMTSRDEGIPRCLMEAMGMKIPVAAYDIRGVDQLIEHNVTGMLSQFGDTRRLSEHWIRLLSDKDHAKRLGSAAREFVQARFSAERMANEYAELFQGLLRG
jgi:glycosyltransferase involved in cell wall biosynthesis